MSEEDYKLIFAKNLRRLLEINNKNQNDLIRDLGLSSSTTSSWCTGQKLPRMNKIQMLADYFGVEKSTLLEEPKQDKPHQYYLNEETERIAQEIYDNPDLRILMDASRKTKPEDLKFLIDMAKRFKGTE